MNRKEIAFEAMSFSKSVLFTGKHISHICHAGLSGGVSTPVPVMSNI